MKKSYTIVFVFLIIYFIVTLLLFGVIFNKEIPDTYMIIGNNTWLTLSEDNELSEFSDKKIISKNKFYVYDNNEYKGEYDIQYYNNKWYIFDENRDSIKLDGNFTAVSSNDRIKILNYEINKVVDLNDIGIKMIEEKYNIKIDSIDELNINQKISLDIDNDEKIEDIYFISNMFNQESNSSKGYSFAFFIDNDSLKAINEIIVDDEDRLNSHSYTISNIIDYDNDNKYELVISKDEFRPFPPCHSIYKLSWGRYIPEKSCN